jgi:hypothetical protein
VPVVAIMHIAITAQNVLPLAFSNIFVPAYNRSTSIGT